MAGRGWVQEREGYILEEDIGREGAYIGHSFQCEGDGTDELSGCIFQRYPESDILMSREKSGRRWEEPGTVKISQHIITVFTQSQVGPPGQWQGNYSHPDSGASRLWWLEECLRRTMAVISEDQMNGRSVTLYLPMGLGCWDDYQSWSGHREAIYQAAKHNPHIRVCILHRPSQPGLQPIPGLLARQWADDGFYVGAVIREADDAPTGLGERLGEVGVLSAR